MQNQKKLNTKYIFPLIQLIVLGILCVSIFDKECVILVKNTIESFHINEGLRSTIYRVLISAKLLFDAPSLFALLLVVLQFFCITSTILFVIYLLYSPFKIAERYSLDCEYSLHKKLYVRETSYLKTIKLLC